MGIGILASGTGTNLRAILDAVVPVSVVVVDRECGAIAIAEEAGVPVERVERTKPLDRVEFTHRVVDALARHDVLLVPMAGFMTILEKPIFDAFPGRVLNTHPSLLPSFPGAHAVEDALADLRDQFSIVLGKHEVDAGPILAQEAVPVRPGDTVETLHERIKQVERRLYPATIKELLESMA